MKNDADVLMKTRHPSAKPAEVLLASLHVIINNYENPDTWDYFLEDYCISKITSSLLRWAV